GVEVVEEAVVRPHLVHAADLAGLEHLPRPGHRRQEQLVVGAHQRDGVARHRRLDVACLFRAEAERLLAQDVLAVVGRGDDRVAVQVMGQADVDRVDVAARRRAEEGRERRVAGDGAGPKAGPPTLTTPPTWRYDTPPSVPITSLENLSALSNPASITPIR